MASITTREYPITPTMKWTDAEGRLTGEGFRLMRAVAELVEAVTIEDGEITTDMLEAEVIRVSTLFADEVIITSKVAPNAITDVSIGIQVGAGAPDGTTLASVLVPVTSSSNTGVILTFTGVQGLPSPNPANFGSWQLVLTRNGIAINGTGAIYYDDNFANLIAAQFVDDTPGTNPTYEVYAIALSGPGSFSLSDGVLNGALFKR